MRRLIALATVATVAAIVVVIAALTGGGSQQPASAAAGAYAPSAGGRPAAAVTVALRKSRLGAILVDARGRTLYLFEADKRGASNCSGACASVWPPLTTSATPHADVGVTAAKLATIVRVGGERQVTYNGHPLYTYAGDSRPGATDGQGLDQFGAAWYVLNAAGAEIGGD